MSTEQLPQCWLDTMQDIPVQLLPGCSAAPVLPDTTCGNLPNSWTLLSRKNGTRKGTRQAAAGPAAVAAVDDTARQLHQSFVHTVGLHTVEKKRGRMSSTSSTSSTGSTSSSSIVADRSYPGAQEHPKRPHPSLVPRQLTERFLLAVQTFCARCLAGIRMYCCLPRWLRRSACVQPAHDAEIARPQNSFSDFLFQNFLSTKENSESSPAAQRGEWWWSGWVASLVRRGEKRWRP